MMSTSRKCPTWSGWAPGRFVSLVIFLIAGSTLYAWSDQVCPRCEFTNLDQDRYCAQCAYALSSSEDIVAETISIRMAEKEKSSQNKHRIPLYIVLALFGAAVLITFITSLKNKPSANVVTDLDRTRMFLSVQVEGQDPAKRRNPQPRRFDRKDMKIPVLCRHEDGTEFKGLVVDMSLGGLGVISKNEIKKGNKIETFFNLKDGGNIKISGTAVFVSQLNDDSFRTGIQFYHLFTEQENFIQQVLDKHS